jgi:hypothetical protein
MGYRVLGVVCLGALLLGGCSQGTGGGDGVASLSTPNSSSAAAPAADAGQTDGDKARAFAKCMREHGVNMPDPQTGDGKIRIKIDGKVDKSTMDKANEACKSLLPNGGDRGPVSAEDLDKMRGVAKCLRAHGMDVPDPTADDPGIKMKAGEGTDQRKVEAAMRECDPDFGKAEKHAESGGSGPATGGGR